MYRLWASAPGYDCAARWKRNEEISCASDTVTTGVRAVRALAHIDWDLMKPVRGGSKKRSRTRLPLLPSELIAARYATCSPSTDTVMVTITSVCIEMSIG